MDAAPGGGVRRAGRRASAGRRRAGQRADGLAAERGRGRGPRAVRHRELADRAAAPDAGQPWARAGPLGAPGRALLRHARLPGAEREPAPGPGNLSTRMQKSFLKKALEGFNSYVPGEQPPDGEDWVKLNTNESPLPPSPQVIEAIKAAAGDALRLYPSPKASPARAAIAEHHGLDVSQVAVGN